MCLEDEYEWGWGFEEGKGGRSSVTMAFARREGGGRGRRAVVVEEGFGSEGIFKGRVTIIIGDGNIEVFTIFIIVSEKRTLLRIKDVAPFST